MANLTLYFLLASIFVSASYASPTGRVVGGVDAEEGQFPHQISLRLRGSHNCGGSIISRYFIMTAAHCVGTGDNANYVTYDPSLLTIRAGSIDRFQGGVIVNVVEVIANEKYGNFLNDIALLRLERPLIYSKNIKAIPLAHSEVPSGSEVVISGWGRIKHGGDLPQILQYNTLYAISQQECYQRIGMNSETLICLDHASNNGACNGDSGGPAVYEGAVVGIAGFVYGGCGSSNPDGYAKVYHHIDWIKQHVYDLEF